MSSGGHNLADHYQIPYMVDTFGASDIMWPSKLYGKEDEEKSGQLRN